MLSRFQVDFGAVDNFAAFRSLSDALEFLQSEFLVFIVVFIMQIFFTFRFQGLYVQSIESGGRIDRDGRLKAADRIVEINGTSLVALDFRRAQEVFREALLTDAVRLRVYKEVKDPPKTPAVVTPVKVFAFVLYAEITDVHSKRNCYHPLRSRI